MKLNRSVLLALVAPLIVGAAAASVMGCKKSTEPDATDTTATAADSAAAPEADPATSEADPSIVTDVGPTAASDPLPEPPPLKVEEQGPAPSDHHVWLAGYWWWDLPNAKYEWTPGFWQDRNVEATAAPPEVIYENPGRAPSAEYTYLPGWWNWNGNQYVWYHGYWGPHRDGFAYVHPFWESVNGHWGSTGWGWDRYDAGWETRHVGWEFHAGVWERPADFQLRVSIARGHAADFWVAPGTWHGHIYGRVDVDVHGRVLGAHAGPNVHPGDSFKETRPAPANRLGGPARARPAHVVAGPREGSRPVARPGEPGHVEPARAEPGHAEPVREPARGEPAREPAHTTGHPVEAKPRPEPAREPARRPEPPRTQPKRKP